MELHAGKQVHKHLINCSECQFTHWHPLPDASTVARYYEDDQFYSTHSPPDWFLKEKAEHEAGLWDSYFDYLASFLLHYKVTFDIGAGCGWFVDYLNNRARRNHTAFGIEPSKSARQFSPISDELLADWEQFYKDFPERSPHWGVPDKGNIVLMLTLEHILNPEQWLREEVLPHLDGRLVVVVPNEWNFLQAKLGGDWFISKVHLNYFSRDSLRALLERCGLSIVAEGATFPTEIWPLIGLDHRKNPDVGRKTHLWRLKLEKRSPGIYRVYSWLFRKWNVGREMILICEKKGG